MTKSELIEALAVRSGLIRADATMVVETIFETITAGLDAGAKVEVHNFGAFRVKSRDGYVSRNPRTGASVRVAPKLTPAFKPSKTMHDRLNG